MIVGAAFTLALALTLSMVSCGRSGPAASSGRPNLLLITVDTLRADRLACYGGEAGVGRALCGIGEGGIRYRWALSPAPSTAPAIASLLTSQYPNQHGVSQFAITFLPDSRQTLAEELAAEGYATAAVISNPVLGPGRNLQQGFDRYDTEMSRKESNRKGYIEREAAAATEAALDWLESAPAPWFLWVHYQDPHGPYAPPDARPALDPPGARRLPLLPDHSGYRGVPAYQALKGAFAVSTYERRYLDEIAYLDAEVERLLQYVETARPGILLTADHGEAFGEDEYWFAHGHSVGLDQARVPLLWRPPEGAVDAAPGVVVGETVTTLDVAPTLLRAAGMVIPQDFLGKVLPARDDPAGVGARPIFIEHRLRAAVVVGGLYYSRDRLALTAPIRDAISGGWLRPNAPRTARLGEDGRLPRYRVVEDDEVARVLAPVLERHLGLAGAQAPQGGAELPRETRRRLEALGYLN